MTLRPILIILSFLVVPVLNAQFYRVYFNDKGENQSSQADYYDLPVNETYLKSIEEVADSLLMVSNWLNYALISHKTFPTQIQYFPFVQSVEIVRDDIDVNVAEEDACPPENDDEAKSLLAWQLDTMGFEYFKSADINGSGITIAILDAGFTGVDASPYFKHLFEKKQIKATLDIIDGDSNVYHGSYHGCMVLSCMAGKDDKVQIGMATGANYILIRTEEALKETMADEDRWVIGIEKAFQMGADIVNSSLGFTIPMHKKADLNGESIISKAAAIATEKGMIVISAAGNEYENVWKSITVPADAKNIISVGAIGKSGDRLSFSSVGPTIDGRLKPELSAPGRCYLVRGNELVINQGTSFAAPVVSGFIACMMQLKGKENVTRANIVQSGSLYPYFDYEYGFGIPLISKFNGEANFISYDTSNIRLNKLKREFIVSADSYQSDKIFFKIQDASGLIRFYGSKRIIPGKSKRIRVPIRQSAPQHFYDKSFYFNPSTTDEWIFWLDGKVYKF